MAASIPAQVEIRYLGNPAVLVDGRPVMLTEDGRSLLSYLALRCMGRARHPFPRAQIAAALWPDVAAEHAAGSLRMAIWRLRSARVPAIESGAAGLRLAEGVRVDVDAVLNHAIRIVNEASARLDSVDGFRGELDFVAAATEALDLLPGCYDEWIEEERSRARSAVLDAFDVVAAERRMSGRIAEAIDLLLIVVSTDPLRERSHANLIAAHLAEGNISEARRTYEQYRRIVITELGVEPPADLTALVDSVPAPGPTKLSPDAALGRALA